MLCYVERYRNLKPGVYRLPMQVLTTILKAYELSDYRVHFVLRTITGLKF